MIDWLAMVVGAMAVLCWCTWWVFAFTWVANLVPWDGMLQSGGLAFVGLAGLLFALLVLKRTLGIRRL